MRDKTFFFAAYEGYRQILGQTLLGFVPTDAFRAQVAAQSPALMPFLNAYPEGSLPVAGNPNVAEFIGNGRQLGNEDSGMMRVDHRFSDKTTAFVRVNIDRAVSNVPLASSGQYLQDTQVLNSSPGERRHRADARFFADSGKRSEIRLQPQHRRSPPMSTIPGRCTRSRFRALPP